MTSTKTTKSLRYRAKTVTLSGRNTLLYYQSELLYYQAASLLHYRICHYIIMQLLYYRMSSYIIKQLLHRQAIITFSVITHLLPYSVEVNIMHIYTSLFNNRVPRRCHNGWNWFWCSQTTLTASGPSVCWCCVTNVQLFQ